MYSNFKILICFLFLILISVYDVYGQSEGIRDNFGSTIQSSEIEADIHKNDYILIQIPKSYIRTPQFADERIVIQVPELQQSGFFTVNVLEIKKVNEVLYGILTELYSKKDLDIIKDRVSRNAKNDMSRLAITKQLINELDHVISKMKYKINEKMK
jgi:hypothetical protein